MLDKQFLLGQLRSTEQAALPDGYKSDFRSMTQRLPQRSRLRVIERIPEKQSLWEV
jgi:hypothetical protein